MHKFWEQIRGIWEKMETPQRVSMVLIAVVFSGIIGLIGFGASRPDYTLLASNLSQAETARIATYLGDQGIPYQLADRDTAILVPRAQRYQLLNILSEQEMLSDGSKGFEILDTGGLGESTFFERRKHDRALAGELERAFREIDGVRNARVLVNRPEESPFLEDDAVPTAAVKLSMKQGQRLSKRQLAGIIHLVTGAIGGIDASNIQVMDDNGLLTDAEQDPGAMAASTSLEAEQAMERHLVRKAQSMLDRILGPGRSMVNVAIDLDFTERREASSTPTDPVVVQQTTRETDSSTPIPQSGGIAGTAANVENAGAANRTVTPPATETTSEETRTFATGKKTVTKNDEVGLVRGMTVSILVDHQKSVTTETAEDGTETEAIAWSPYENKELDDFKKLVLDAIGYEAAKGVQVAIDPGGNATERFTASITSMRMEMPDIDMVPAAAVGGLNMEQLDQYIRYGVAALVAIVLLMVARGQLKRTQAAWEAEQAQRKAEEEAAARAAQASDTMSEAKQEEERRLTLRQEIQKQILEDPDAAASVLRGWIHSA